MLGKNYGARGSSTDSYERSLKDSASVQMKSLLSEEFIAKVPEGRRNAVHTAYAKASKTIIDILNLYADRLSEIRESGYGYNEDGEKVKRGSFYSPQGSYIAMNESMTNDEYTDVIKHELGHFADHMLGTASCSDTFIQAVAAETEKFHMDTSEGCLRLNDLLDDAFSSGACYDRNVTDIMSALLLNHPMIKKRFDQESITGYVAYYQHNTQYWEKTDVNGKPLHMREKECFANIFAIVTDGYRISRDFIERWFPEIVDAFFSIIG